MPASESDFNSPVLSNVEEVATVRDVSEGGVIGAIGGAIAGGLVGGPAGAVIGAAAGATASAAAVDVVHHHHENDKHGESVVTDYGVVTGDPVMDIGEDAIIAEQNEYEITHRTYRQKDSLT